MEVKNTIAFYNCLDNFNQSLLINSTYAEKIFYPGEKTSGE